MRNHRSTLVTLALLAVPGILAAQVSPHHLAGRHHIALAGGFHSAAGAGASVAVPGASVSSSTTGAFGGIGYDYWLDDRLAVGAAVTAMNVSADVAVSGSGTAVATGVVAALQLGGRYQFATLAPSNALRPYLGISVGPLFGIADSISASFPAGVTTVQQTVISGRLALGADLSLGRVVTLGVSAGYLLAQDFAQPVAGRTSYSSPVLGFTLGFLIGRGRPTGGR